MSPRSAGSNNEDFRRGAVAAKFLSPFDIKGDHSTSPYGDVRTTRANSESVHVPFKAPSQVEIRTIPSLSSLCSDHLSGMSIDAAMEICPDLDGDEDLQTWMSTLSPKHLLARNSISTTNTTLYDDRSVHHGGISRYQTGSSGVSTSTESIYSSTTVTDAYGWEEELERQMIEKHRSGMESRRGSITHNAGLGVGPIEFLEPNWGPPGAERRIARHIRMPVQRHRSDRSREPLDGGKRKSLLYRVLNIAPHGQSRGTHATAAHAGVAMDGMDARDHHIYHYPHQNSPYERR